MPEPIGLTPELIITIFSSFSALVTAVIASRSKISTETIRELKDRIERIEKELETERYRNNELTATLDGYMSEKLKANREILDLKLQLDQKEITIQHQEKTIEDLQQRMKALEYELYGRQSYEPPRIKNEDDK